MEAIEARSDAITRQRFRLSLSAWAGVFILVFWLFIAFFGPALAPFSESDFVSDDSFLPIGRAFLLGTDYIGRDLLSRLFHGTRLTLGMALLATLIASTVGSSLGIFSAIKGGGVDMLLCRINDALVSIPGIMMGLVVIAALGSSIPILICTTGLVYACSVFRIARALGMDLMVMDYVEVARARGESVWWILGHEIFPNAAIPLIVDFGIRLSFAIRFMSSLSFLGLGVQPPHADWGSMVRENLVGLNAQSMAPIIPALAIASLTIGLNLIVDDYVARSGQEVAKRIT
ncbi:MAG: ABC transporter permease [Thermodesulfobacteriota bacterium]